MQASRGTSGSGGSRSLPGILRTTLGLAVGALTLVLPTAAGAHSRQLITARTARAACRDVGLAAHSGDAPRLAASIACLINVAREDAGLPPLRPDRALSSAALSHSRSMSNSGYFGHDGPGGSPMQRMRAAGARCGRYCSAGENIAWASGRLSTPLQIVQAWLNSPPHRRNILDPSFRQEGVGVAAGGNGAVVTQDFMGR